MLYLASQSMRHLSIQTELSLEVILFAVMFPLVCHLGERKDPPSTVSFSPIDKGRYQKQKVRGS